MMGKTMRLISLLFLSAGLVACATGTGPDAARRFTEFEAVTTSDFRGYDRVHLVMPVAGEEIIERIDRRQLGRSAIAERPLGEEDITRALTRLDGDLRRELGPVVTLVETPGPGILTIEPVLIDLDANRPTMTELSFQPQLSMMSISAGDAEVIYRFSEDGRLLATARDRDIEETLGQIPPVAGIWDTADRFFDLTARRMRALLSD
ncbi:MAG: hypothetical protein V2I43_10305 [Parvularcula sp.]|jgi:hypothetical protein|nr:hypothetical protein [Parvularcula sp.]